MEQAQMMTPQEAARVLNIHINTLYLHIQRGGLKAYKVGGRWRLTERDIKDFCHGITAKG